MTPNELYKRDWKEGDRVILNKDNLPEAGLNDWEAEVFEKAEWIKIKNHGFIQSDYRRYWQLASVWFLDKPVMIIRNAGREGDDRQDRFITDVPLFWQMVAYLQVLKVHRGEPPKDTVNPDKDIPNLTEFYGNSLNDFR